MRLFISRISWRLGSSSLPHYCWLTCMRLWVWSRLFLCKLLSSCTGRIFRPERRISVPKPRQCPWNHQNSRSFACRIVRRTVPQHRLCFWSCFFWSTNFTERQQWRRSSKIHMRLGTWLMKLRLILSSWVRQGFLLEVQAHWFCFFPGGLDFRFQE